MVSGVYLPGGNLRGMFAQDLGGEVIRARAVVCLMSWMLGTLGQAILIHFINMQTIVESSRLLGFNACMLATSDHVYNSPLPCFG
jgi:hypothetical protein